MGVRLTQIPIVFSVDEYEEGCRPNQKNGMLLESTMKKNKSEQCRHLRQTSD
jgi:hypothetical protein